MAAKKAFKDMTDLEHLGITGNVKEVMQACYKAHYQQGSIITGKIETNPPLRHPNILETFNEKGYHREKTEYRSFSNQKTIYDENRHAIKNINFKNKDTISTITTSVYDNNGNHIESISTQADGSIISRRVSAYNDDNKRISEHVYDKPEKVLREYSLFSYTEKGDMLSYIQYRADDTIKYSHKKTYDDKGKVIEEISEFTDPAMAKQNKRTVHKYNDHGDCIEFTIYNLDGTLRDTYTSSYEYDNEGKRIIPESTFELYPLVPGETEAFQYDEHGNWIKKTVSYKNIPGYIVMREILYADDPADKTLTHPLDTITPDENAVPHVFKQEELADKEAQWLAESNAQAEQFPLVRYYTLFYKEFPSIITYTQANIEAEYLLKRLKESMGARLLHSYSNSHSGYRPGFLRYTLCFPAYFGYLLQVHNISTRDADEFDIPSYMSDIYQSSFSVLTGQAMLLKPSENYGHIDEYFEEEMERHIEAAILNKKPEKPVINIIEVSNNSFVITEHSVDDDFEIKDLDINYGYGFRKFHDELLHRFTTSTKGLVLFHGEPGTGKTYYIRHLLRTMVARKKEVIYMPPNMVDHLADPAFMTFLTQIVKSRSEEGNFCVLLIEDAEPLLARRQQGVRIQGVTNLLNMSDGILNDLLNLQIICTFNVSVNKLDSALLRPGRLIARKEFKPLSVIDANRLAQRIGIKHHFKAPATLGEIYALQKDSNTLLHDVDYNEDSSEPIDDLI